MVGVRWSPDLSLLQIPKLEVVMWLQVENSEPWIRAARRRSEPSSVVARRLVLSDQTELPVAPAILATAWATAVESKTDLKLAARIHALARVKVLESMSVDVRDIHFDFYQILETDFLNRLIFVTNPPGLTNVRCHKTDQSTDHVLHRWNLSAGRCCEWNRDHQQIPSDCDMIAAPDFADRAVVHPHPTQTDSNPSAAEDTTSDHAGLQTLHLAADLELQLNQTRKCPMSASRAKETTAA